MTKLAIAVGFFDYGQDAASGLFPDRALKCYDIFHFNQHEDDYTSNGRVRSAAA